MKMCESCNIDMTEGERECDLCLQMFCPDCVITCKSENATVYFCGFCVEDLEYEGEDENDQDEIIIILD